MTESKAIGLLSNATYSDEWQGNEELTTAISMAIKALEKQDCVYEVVCEWEYKHPFGDFPSCRNVNSISRDRNWKYCPYCGKKIKVVQDVAESMLEVDK